MPGQRTSSCSRTWKKIQPGSTGIQCVANRYARTAATAGPDVLPTPVRPATSAASLAPSLGPFGQPGRPHCGAVHLPAGRAVVEEADGVIYLAAALRNAGNGVANKAPSWSASRSVRSARCR